MSGDLHATLRQTVDNMVAAYSSPESWSPDQIWATRTDDCLHYIHPKIPEAFRAPLDKDHHIRALIAVAVTDVQTHTVVARLTAEYNLLAVDDEGPIQGLTTEFMWLMEMDERGTKIKRIEEFLDQSSFLALVTGKAAKYANSQK
ncbi:hypothetical protein QQS21_002005 [Conoideocrella luteorostrata]|uniref:SnoaL-like domain-containing protein n=1 Tax=Conoideocrella luteorostrata TaxID=1105319 RepID=A0AAJ0CW56_9HYPO|nr:hypothetical protein QQS21_002005 [Conoideocrella luteorostrata]